ncbi:MAG: hypothetical protein Q9M43_14650 [Sulfurimonas sp.]|nr:hypothetical protein [Sulfurimonas sp.]
MTTKQASIKILDVTLSTNENFIAYFNKNHIIFKNHLIVLHGEINDVIESYLKDKELNFVVNVAFKKASFQKEISDEKIKEKVIPQEAPKLEPIPEAPKTKTTLKVLDKLIRSGQELKLAGDLLLLNRVNSGGTINIEGNLIITEIVEGSIRCNGDFMMLKASPKANIVFHEVEVDNTYLSERLNRVELKNNEITITPVLKETNWG